MIAEFTIENYRSFKEKHTFSMISTKNKELSDLNTFEIDKKLCFLKTAVIYGANASGKSNFFLALRFFLDFVVNSGPNGQIGYPIGAEPFIFSRQTEDKPSFFEIIFYIINDDQKIRYRYGLSANKDNVVNEYLFAIFNTREVPLFTRESQDIICTSYFKEGNRIRPAVRNNSSFLSVCAQNNGDISAQIIIYFQNIFITSGLQDLSAFTKKELHNSIYIQKVLGFLQYADTQIKNLKIESIPVDLDNGEFSKASEVIAFFSFLKKKLPEIGQQEMVYFGHTLYDGEQPVGERFLAEGNESTGTQKLFSYSMPILMALEQGTPLFIDEFDASLHPLIIEAIIKLFNSPDKNPKNAQLVISCHAVNILTNKLFRRDQIWFCEKDQYGATKLYSLVEYNDPVRNDAAFGKNYLQGNYGAIPHIDKMFLQVGNIEVSQVKNNKEL
ncbi:transporter [Spirochaetia bacterium]|nr:transporter [Spirochaetia bacterium]